ncbi:MAG: penicillin acylase family protein [Anaerolineae bacterium]|nr:penicillin acylase family protein [Anaerolineae bacterium]
MPPRWALLLALLLLTGLPAQGQGHQAHITWDAWGVPHITASDNISLWYAAGWAQAQLHGDLLLRLYAQGRGQAAALGGAAYLEDDLLTHRLNIPQAGADDYAAAPPEFRQLLDAFAAGVTRYVELNPVSIDDTWAGVLPITGADILRHGSRSLRYNFVAGQGIAAARRWQNDQDDTPPPPPSGSNAWAIGPTRAAGGHAMLLANPHQPWADMGLWVEMHFITPDLNLYGAALIGSPVINIGFNERLGWTHTVNTHDGWDLYRLRLSEDGGSYWLDGTLRPLTQREVIVQVREEDGTLRPVPLTVAASEHGPLLARREDGTALALRVVGANASLAAWQWWQMGTARSLAEFEAALEPIHIPMFTIMYADVDGNILHVFNEQIPVHASGDWAFWNNTTPVDRSRPAIIPGDDSQYIWTQFHPYRDLPRVLNPPTGWLQNANEPPWLTTYPPVLRAEDYPPYFAPPPLVWPRPTRSLRLLYEDASITFEELQHAKYDTRMQLADEVLPDLLAAAAASEDELLRRAGAVLAAWDRRADQDSVGAALFTLWAINYVQRVGVGIYAIPFDPADPLHTPRGLADPAGAAAALAEAARTLEATRLIGGGIDVPYGEAFRLRYLDAGVDWPASGGFDVVGTFSILTFVQDTDLRFRAVHGDSFIALVEFSEPIRAKVLLSYGNASQPGSPHVGDQLVLLAERRYRDALITPAQVASAAVRVEAIRIPR